MNMIQKKVRFFRKKLKNGMTVLFEKRETGVVSLAFATKYGAVNEGLNEKGIAHFIEHLLYKGTSKRNTQQISKEIESKGGVLNGFTSESITAFWAKIPSRHIGIALGVLGDMIKNPLFAEKEIEKERKVIFEEMKLYKDNPHLHVHDMILENLYSGTLGRPIIGSEKTLGSVNRVDLVKKFNEVYATDNLILCVVGDADFNRICNFAEKNFSKTKSKVSKPKFGLLNKSGIEKRKGIDQVNLVLAHHVPSAQNKKHYAAQVLNTILAGGMSSRLFSEIREKRNLAYSVKGSCNCDKEFGYDSIYVGTTKENIKLVKELILKEFKDVFKNLSEKELNEAKEQLIGNNKISQEDSQSQMLELLYGEMFGDPNEVYKFEKNIKSVKLKDVRAIANLKKYSFFALVPE
jgi:predicted Zn-dependent peptidase